jgi:hypothetical protein
MYQERMAVTAVPAVQLRWYADTVAHGNTSRKFNAPLAQERILGKEVLGTAEKHPYSFCGQPRRFLFSGLELPSHRRVTTLNFNPSSCSCFRQGFYQTSLP